MRRTPESDEAMGETKNVTYEKIAAAADELVAEGRRPTLRAVREKLQGTGSQNTICRFMQKWREEHPEAADIKVPGSDKLELRATKIITDVEAFRQEVAEFRGTFEELKAENSDFSDVIREQAKQESASQAQAEAIRKLESHVQELLARPSAVEMETLKAVVGEVRQGIAAFDEKLNGLKTDLANALAGFGSQLHTREQNLASQVEALKKTVDTMPWAAIGASVVALEKSSASMADLVISGEPRLTQIEENIKRIGDLEKTADTRSPEPSATPARVAPVAKTGVKPKAQNGVASGSETKTRPVVRRKPSAKP
jgi:chromosome segregation ATPase